MTSPCPSRSTTPVHCRAADALRDDDWDRFLQGTELGHFQQSSLWAQYKHHEGWQPERVVLADDGGPLAGFQLLWRRSRLGRIGYISKGPAARDAASAPWDELTRQIQSTANRLKLQAVIVQSPDWAPEAVPVLRRYGFLDNHLHDVIRATLLIDLSPGWDQIARSFRHDTRNNIRRLTRDGYRIFPGRAEDVPQFFTLMQAMCERLGTRPNPGSEAALAALWHSFDRRGLATMLMARRNAQILGGLLLLRFGSRLTVWKQACDPAKVRRRPDTLVWAESIRLAIETGCRWFDFVSFNPATTIALREGTKSGVDKRISRDFFHLGFGGEPLNLPDPLVWLSHPWARRLYRMAIRIPWFRQLRGWLA